MKNALVMIVCLGLLSVSTAPSQTGPEDWENPSVLHINTELPHAAFIPFPDAEGWGLLVAGDPVFEFSAHPHWPEDLTQESRGSMHPPDVQRRDFTCLTLDGAQMGVGGDDSWGARIHPPYTLPARSYGFMLRFIPLAPGDDPGGRAQAARRDGKPIPRAERIL